MKKLLILVLMLCAAGLMAQPSVSIFPVNQTTCLGGRAALDVFINPDTAAYYLRWYRNGNPFTVEDSTESRLQLANLTYADTGFYTVTVVTSSGSFGSDTAWVHILPALTIDTLYRYNKLGCPGSCKGQMKVQVSGGNPPYDYYWGGGASQDTIVTSLCKGTYLLSVYDSDSTHCVSREYKIEVLTLPKVTFTTDPVDSVFLTNPTLTVMFPDTSRQHLSNWEWIFFESESDDEVRDSTVVSNQNPATHVYTRTGTFNILLHYTDLEGCDSTASMPITVMIAKLFIPNVFTPNGDGVNENFVIKVENGERLSDVYTGNELVVLNRWGRKVYSKTNYVSDNQNGEWNGENLAEGVYFYIFTGHGYYGDDVWKGSVTILGKNYKKE